MQLCATTNKNIIEKGISDTPIIVNLYDGCIHPSKYPLDWHWENILITKAAFQKVE